MLHQVTDVEYITEQNIFQRYGLSLLNCLSEDILFFINGSTLNFISH